MGQFLGCVSGVHGKAGGNYWRLRIAVQSRVSVYPGLKALADLRLKPVLRRGGLCR